VERPGVACAAPGKSGGFLALDWCDGSPLGPLARASLALHAELATRCRLLEDEMAAIGIRELRARAGQVIRGVRDHGEVVDITHDGKVVARVVPVSWSPSGGRRAAAVWSTLDRVAREIGTSWPKRHSTSAAVRKGRRRL
jgi:prevent-host-death family protein